MSGSVYVKMGKPELLKVDMGTGYNAPHITLQCAPDIFAELRFERLIQMRDFFRKIQEALAPVLDPEKLTKQETVDIQNGKMIHAIKSLRGRKAYSLAEAKERCEIIRVLMKEEKQPAKAKKKALDLGELLEELNPPKIDVDPF